VHPIFGAFLAGLICPHEGGFAIKITEKIEDLMSALFLPLYFTLSGLSTNLGLLDNGITWGYLIAVTVVAFSAKFIGCALAARLNGMVWRESFSIGALMSCKGLVELIVLNIGLQAKILSTRVFTMVRLSQLRASEEDWALADSISLVVVRCHGTYHNLCYYTAHLGSVSTVVPEKAPSMERWEDRLGHRSINSQ
jgi:Kef-type K+ transport system membrane component KefB